MADSTYIFGPEDEAECFLPFIQLHLDEPEAEAHVYGLRVVEHWPAMNRHQRVLLKQVDDQVLLSRQLQPESGQSVVYTFDGVTWCGA